MKNTSSAVEDLKARIQESIAKKDALIKQQIDMYDNDISNMEKSLKNFEKLIFGNVITSDNGVCLLITSNDIVFDEEEKKYIIPIRHHVEMYCSVGYKFWLNYSGCYEPLGLTADEIGTLNIMTLSEFIESRRDKLQEQYIKEKERLKERIDKKVLSIKQMQKELEDMIHDYDSSKLNNCDDMIDSFKENAISNDICVTIPDDYWKKEKEFYKEMGHPYSFNGRYGLNIPIKKGEPQ